MLRIENDLGVLRHLLDDVDDVDFLVAELAQRGHVVGGHRGFTLGLAGEDEHRHGIGVGAEDAVDRVESARPGGDVDEAEGAGDARVALGGHGAGLLVVIAGPAEARLARDGIVEVHGAAARDEKDVADPMFDELLDNVIRETHH